MLRVLFQGNFSVSAECVRWKPRDGVGGCVSELGATRGIIVKAKPDINLPVKFLRAGVDGLFSYKTKLKESVRTNCAHALALLPGSMPPVGAAPRSPAALEPHTGHHFGQTRFPPPALIAPTASHTQEKLLPGPLLPPKVHLMALFSR